MKPDRWQRVNELLEAIWDLEPQQQADFLDQACSGDAELRQQVEEMLASSTEAETFLEAPAVLSQPRISYEVPKQIGPYHLVRELGRGGMGAVYLGEREKDAFHQRVAVKLIKRGMDSDEIVDRFKKERQILANLDHPNIARLLDGGTTQQGQPFFVMEFVEGQPIDQYCREQRLPLRKRLELVVEVCAAVHFINQNLIVHRDLKPSNILVTAEGTPKLLDFGIAKILDQRNVASTATGMRPMTPEYASPEQILGEPVTTASDVYALGVLLYVLLTDHTPYRLERGGLRELEDAICQKELAKPSSVVAGEWVSRNTLGEEVRISPEQVAASRREEPRNLVRHLAGDLDHIAMMALRKEARHRYGSAQALADDLERYLMGFSVKAHVGSWRYHAGKFIRRNRVGVLTAAAAMILITTFAITMTVQRQAIARERDKAQEMASFLIELFQRSDHKGDRGDTVTSREIVEMQRRLLGQDHPDVAKSLFQLGSLLNASGDHLEALSLYREALDIRIKALGNDHPDVTSSRYTLAFLLTEMSHFEEAEQLFSQALERIDQHTVQTTQILLALARLHNRWEHYSQSLALFQQAQAEFEKLLGKDNMFYVSTRHNIGLTLAQMGEPEQAVPALVEALAAYRLMLPSDHPQIATCMLHLGAILSHLHRFTQAEPLLRETVAAHLQNMPVGDARTGMAQSALGHCLAAQGCFQEAEGYLLEGFTIISTHPEQSDRYLNRTIYYLYDLYDQWGLPQKRAHWNDLR